MNKTWKLFIVYATAILLHMSSNIPVCSQEKFRNENAHISKKSSWTIGTYTGSSPFHLKQHPDANNPVFTAEFVNDFDVDIVAHPFMIVTDSIYYMFFTAKDEKTDKGGIGLAVSKNGIDWEYKQMVLREKFVLAYPYVFKWQNEYYMIPEAHTENSLRLYKAIKFPESWQYEGDLLSGEKYIAPTLFRHNDLWWLFTIRPGNETLRLFFAENFKDKFIEHPQSPIVEKNLRTARPGGKPFILDGTVYRVGMDCLSSYGYQLNAFQITELTTTTYAETMIDIPLLKASAKGWNADAMHHLDVHKISNGKWIAVVDALGK